MPRLENKNIVVVANNLNPSIFKEAWLIKKEIFTEEEIDDETSFFTPAIVNVKTAEADLAVMPERLQVTIKDEKASSKVAEKIIVGIVQALPETPYTAIGFNFIWSIRPSDESKYPSIIQNMFLSEKNPLKTYFASEDAMFGFYASKDALTMRLKLDVKPTKTIKENTPQLLLSFNFDKVLSSEVATTEIKAIIKKWESAQAMSEEMVREVCKDWGA